MGAFASRGMGFFCGLVGGVSGSGWGGGKGRGDVMYAKRGVLQGAGEMVKISG